MNTFIEENNHSIFDIRRVIEREHMSLNAL